MAKVKSEDIGACWQDEAGGSEGSQVSVRGGREIAALCRQGGGSEGSRARRGVEALWRRGRRVGGVANVAAGWKLCGG